MSIDLHTPQQKSLISNQIQLIVYILFLIVQSIIFQQSFLQNMKNPDFQGIYKYKLVMPTFLLVNVFLFFFGPTLCPNFTQIFYFLWTILITRKALHMGFVSFYCLYQNKRVLHRLENQINLKLGQELPEILHAIIIPNYNEPIQVIKETLNKLSKHSRAKQIYFIYLAMQKRQLNYERKAEILINEFKPLFRNIDFTVHELQPDEFPGKGANVNWCSRRLEEKFKKMNQKIEKCFLTIVDSDNEIPELYFIEMEDHIRKNWNQRFTFVFGPFKICNKNHLNVPVFTRVFDYLCASFQMSNIVNLTGFAFAISNYSASFNLIKKIDFWDTNQDSITEDIHFMLKACWKTEGQMKTVPIFVPTNEASIETGNGYWEDIKAKFQTTQRQLRVCNDIAYSLRMFFNSSFNWKTFRMVLILLDTFALQVFYMIVMIVLPYHKSILTPNEMADLPVSYETIQFMNMLTVLGIVLYVINYEIVSRRSIEKIFLQTNRKWYTFFEVPIFFLVVQYLLLLPASIYAIFGSLKKNRTWFMARKNSNKKVE